MTPWTVACQAPLSMGFSRQEYWGGQPFPFPGDLPNPGIEPRSPALPAYSLPAELPEKPLSLNDLWYLNEGEVGLLKNNEYHTSILALNIGSVQFSRSVVSDCDPMKCSTPGLPVHHQLPEFTQTYVHRVSDAIQPSHPLSSLSPSAPNPSQHQSLFQ